MTRIKCIITYDGTYFNGYQVQPNKRTVQEEIENVLTKMHKGKHVRIVASGRTDASVHAVGQVIHFDTPLSIPIEKWTTALNAMLPNDIAVLSCEQVHDDFHARFDVREKEYRYKILLSDKKDVFKRNYLYHFPYKLDVQLMNKAIQYLTGTHDFTSFCSAKTEVKDKVRTIYNIEVLVEGKELTFRFIGNGFLYNMVRILVGTLLNVGQGIIQPEEIKSILEKKDRTFAGKTVPGHGLYLWQVQYDN
ncbi:tRNA pseudouridine(38-40) synthase TruA [Bacillus timonensis]|nr:tRNA pseudouridine(38-40) synthase TruA [Bacillus timonensis]